MTTTPRPAARKRGFGNRILDILPRVDQVGLRPLLEPVHGTHKELYQDAGKPITSVYFPVDAVVSVLTTLEEGSAVEIATIGNEGMVGSPLFLGSRSMPAREFAQVQVPGASLRMDADAFTAQMAARGALFEGVQRYVQAFFSQISQQVACNGCHTVEERCCRWLLLTHDRVRTDEFPLTHEFLSQMLGVRRASVTLAAGALQHAGFIRYRHGRVTIVDREGLEGTSCECYRVISDEFQRLLGGEQARWHHPS